MEKVVSKGAMGFWVGVSWVMAIATVFAALLLCIGYGVIEVQGRYITKTVVNWPLVVGCAISAAYAVMFAVAMSMMRISALNTRAMFQRILEQEARAAEELSPGQDPGAE